MAIRYLSARLAQQACVDMTTAHLFWVSEHPALD